MASTASEIIATAKTEAEAARQSALANLSGMSNNLQQGYDTQKQATTDYYTNMINNLDSQYQKDAKGAYGTMMGNRQTLSNNLNRLGLQNSGYGVTQMLGINSDYGKNLATLQNTLATNKQNTGVQQQQALADLYNNYLKNRNSLDQYMYEAGQNAYDTAYKNSYQAQQDEIANRLQEMSIMASMARSSGGRGSDESEIEIEDDGSGINPYTGTKHDDLKFGTFGNGYQPSTIGGAKLSKTGKTVGNLYKNKSGSSGIDLSGQNIWTYKSNGKTKYAMWDGSINDYVDITSDYNSKFKSSKKSKG